MVAFIDRPSRGLWGRVDLPGRADRPIDVFRHSAAQLDPTRRSARTERDEVLKAIIQRIWREHDQVYGSRKVWQTNGPGRPPGGALPRAALDARTGPAWRRPGTGVDHDDAARAAAAAARPIWSIGSSTATRPNQLWVADFTYVATWRGFVYVAFVIDVFARRIVGWRVSSSLRTDFVLDALEQAIYARCDDTVGDLVHHSDSKNIRASCPGRPDPHSDGPSELVPRGVSGALTRTPTDRQPCLSSDLSAARAHLAARLRLAGACDPRRA